MYTRSTIHEPLIKDSITIVTLKLYWINFNARFYLGKTL